MLHYYQKGKMYRKYKCSKIKSVPYVDDSNWRENVLSVPRWSRVTYYMQFKQILFLTTFLIVNLSTLFIVIYLYNQKFYIDSYSAVLINKSVTLLSKSICFIVVVNKNVTLNLNIVYHNDTRFY